MVYLTFYTYLIIEHVVYSSLEQWRWKCASASLRRHWYRRDSGWTVFRDLRSQSPPETSQLCETPCEKHGRVVLSWQFLRVGFIIGVLSHPSDQVVEELYSFKGDFTVVTEFHSIPDEVYVKSLERAHAQIVYENWPYNDCATVEQVADEIDQMPSAGVFLKESHQLVSWATHFPVFGISRLHTLEAYRRRGYGTLAIIYVAKMMAQSGYVPWLGVVSTNSASNLLVSSAGFKLFRVADEGFLSPITSGDRT